MIAYVVNMYNLFTDAINCLGELILHLKLDPIV